LFNNKKLLVIGKLTDKKRETLADRIKALRLEIDLEGMGTLVYELPIKLLAAIRQIDSIKTVFDRLVVKQPKESISEPSPTSKPITPIPPKEMPNPSNSTPSAKPSPSIQTIPQKRERKKLNKPLVIQQLDGTKEKVFLERIFPIKMILKNDHYQCLADKAPDEICNRRFSSPHSFNIHKGKIHNINWETYVKNYSERHGFKIPEHVTCNYCDRWFTNHELENHLVVCYHNPWQKVKVEHLTDESSASPILRCRVPNCKYSIYANEKLFLQHLRNKHALQLIDYLTLYGEKHDHALARERKDRSAREEVVKEYEAIENKIETGEISYEEGKKEIEVLFPSTTKSNRVYKCDLQNCEFSHESEEALRAHVLIHHKLEWEHYLNEMEAIEIRKAHEGIYYDYIDYEEIKEENGVFECKVPGCKWTTTTKGSFKGHIKRNHELDWVSYLKEYGKSHGFVPQDAVQCRICHNTVDFDGKIFTRENVAEHEKICAVLGDRERLTSREYIILKVIMEFPGLNLNQLSQKAKIPTTSIGAYVNTLEAANIIYTKYVANARQCFIRGDELEADVKTLADEAGNPNIGFDPNRIDPYAEEEN
jgi:hypothetical protein